MSKQVNYYIQYRDGVITNNSDIEYRRSSFEKYFVMLEKHGEYCVS